MNCSRHLVAARAATGLRKRRYVAVAVIALAAFVAPTDAIAAGPASCFKPRKEAYEAKSTSFHLLEAGKSSKGTPVRFYNYSFAHRTCANHLNVEWPIGLIVKDNATKERIENEMRLFYHYGAPLTSTDYARINDGAGTFWAGDRGLKSSEESCGTSDVHYRIYAYNQRSYAIGLGYFVIGALHKDNNEGVSIGCEFGKRTFGESEKAEKTFGTNAKTFTEKAVWEVAPDAYDMKNPEPLRREGNHIFENNGLATIIDAH